MKHLLLALMDEWKQEEDRRQKYNSFLFVLQYSNVFAQCF